MFPVLQGALPLGDRGTSWLCLITVPCPWEFNSSPNNTGLVFLLHVTPSNLEVGFEWLWGLPPIEPLMFPWHLSQASRNSKFALVVLCQ